MITIITILFVVGYLAIVFEHNIKINKAASALLLGVLSWTVFGLYHTVDEAFNTELGKHLQSAAEILFFLLGAMTIVELIDAHGGFNILISKIKTKNKYALLWIIGISTFFLSSILDNLTTTIVFLSFLQKLIKNREDRLILASIVVVAANAGGAWSPIGDVTTTMIWIKNKITTLQLMDHIFLASVVSLVVPLLILKKSFSGKIETNDIKENEAANPHSLLVLIIGLGLLIFVPVFKSLTHLPPYIGMLFSLGMMWVVVEIINSAKDDEEKERYSVGFALQKVDTPSILFFLGILLTIGVLESTGILHSWALAVENVFHDYNLICIFIGIMSSIIDNVPLVAASLSMYSSEYGTDHPFWHLLAYTAGTGGSILIIGSAAGVVAMGIEKIEFFWYFKKFSWIVLIGYLAGCGVFLVEKMFF
jgi:Na+/H+ antiporter NhaD/arsenite permease-like protein